MHKYWKESLFTMECFVLFLPASAGAGWALIPLLQAHRSVGNVA